VRALVHYNSLGSLGWLEHSELTREMEVVQGDVRDFDRMLRSIDGVDCVLHLAALIGIPYSYLSPMAYIQTNVIGTNNVLEACRMQEVESVVVTSTSETYGTAQYVPMDEKHPNVGQSPYSASKIGADQLAISYHRSFGLPVRVLRPFNTYGPRQSARAVLPTIAAQLLAGVSKLRLGNLSPTRDLTFVEDTARAFLAAADCTELIGRVANAGSGKEISVGEVAQLLMEVTGCKVDIEQADDRVRPTNSEVERLFCDNSLLLSLTDWKPSVSLREGLARTVQWLRMHRDLYKEGIYNV